MSIPDSNTTGTAGVAAGLNSVLTADLTPLPPPIATADDESATTNASISVSAAAAAPASAAAASLTAAPVSGAAAASAATPRNALPTGVGFSILSDRNQAMKGVRNVLKVLCQIKPPKTDVQRPPFHISVVLDKSGSMQVENRLRDSKRVMNIHLCM